MNSYTSTNIRFYIYLFFILQKYLKLFVKMQQVLNIPCYICIYFENNKILTIRMINIFVGKFENLELFLYENLGNISSLFYQSILKRYIQYSIYSRHLNTKKKLQVVRFFWYITHKNHDFKKKTCPYFRQRIRRNAVYINILHLCLYRYIL